MPAFLFWELFWGRWRTDSLVIVLLCQAKVLENAPCRIWNVVDVDIDLVDGKCLDGLFKCDVSVRAFEQLHELFPD